MNRLPPEIDGCVPAVPKPPTDPPEGVAVAAHPPRPARVLDSIEDALLDEINPLYPWA